MFAFAHTLFAPSMALALVILGFQLVMPLKRAVTEFGKTYKDRFALRTYPGTSVPIFIFILGWSRTKPRVTLSAQTMSCCR